MTFNSLVCLSCMACFFFSPLSNISPSVSFIQVYCSDVKNISLFRNTFPPSNVASPVMPLMKVLYLLLLIKVLFSIISWKLKSCSAIYCIFGFPGFSTLCMVGTVRCWPQLGTLWIGRRNTSKTSSIPPTRRMVRKQGLGTRVRALLSLELRLPRWSKSSSASGVDEIRPEFLKALDVVGLSWLTQLCNIACMWGAVSLDWQTGVVVPLFKKGDQRLCSNYRGITLLSLPGKVYLGLLDPGAAMWFSSGSWNCGSALHPLQDPRGSWEHVFCGLWKGFRPCPSGSRVGGSPVVQGIRPPDTGRPFPVQPQQRGELMPDEVYLIEMLHLSRAGPRHKRTKQLLRAPWPLGGPQEQLI